MKNARLAETRPFPKLAAAPELRDLDRDGSDDLLFSDLRIGLVRGRADRRFVPETFSTYRLPQSQLHVVGVHSMVVQGTAAYVTLARIDGNNGLYVADAFTGKLELRAKLGRDIEELAGRPVAGDLIEGEGSPCLEILAAFRGAESFSMFEVCRPRSPTDPAIADFPESMPFWLDQARETVVHLPPGVTLDDEAPVVADIDGDGHLDALVGAAGRGYLARGDGRSLATLAEAYSLPFAGNAQVSPAIPMPLAAGDFSNDGFVDFVFKDRLITSSRVPGSAEPDYTITQGTKGEPWTTALVADFNGNGMLDVVAASSASAGVQFFNGTGGLFQIASTLPTDRPVLDLARGDFDGDRITDVAFIEAAPQSGRDSLHIAFGNSATPPSPPVQVGQLANANALASYGDAGLDSLLVSSSGGVGFSYQGALTLLGGSSDRLPFAPCALVSFSLDGSIVNALAIDFKVGKFTRDGTNDVLALASDNFATHWSQLVATTARSTLERRHRPLRATAGTLIFAPTAAPVTSFALLDGERSELLFTTRSGLYSARTDETGRAFEAPVQRQTLDAVEAVTVADVNGDGIADLVVADARGMSVLRAALAP